MTYYLGVLMGNARSGRKSRYEEIQRGNILKIATDWLVKNFDTFDKDTKLKIALVIVPKGITERHEVIGKIERDEEMESMFSNWRQSLSTPFVTTIQPESGVSTPRLAVSDKSVDSCVRT